MIALFVSAAFAQSAADWQFQSGGVVSPDAMASWATLSVSNPSVIWDRIHAQYVMAFESRTATVDANCPNGIWEIGLATSPDGVTWTKQAAPLLTPDPAGATFWSCVAAHPSLVYRTTTAAQVPSMYLHFKAEGWNGVNNGIGVALVKFNGATPYLRTVWSAPALAANGRSYATPHVIRQGSKWRMVVQDYPDVVEFVSTSPTSFTAAGAVALDFSALRAPVVPWVVNEFFNPSYVCDDDPVGNNDLALFVGGRDTEFGAVVAGSWAKAVSNRTNVAFALDTTPQVSWSTNTEWRHWDVLGLTSGEYLVYFDEKDAFGNNFIRLGGTDLAWTSSQVRTRYCP